MNYYLLIIFLLSNFFLFSIFNLTTYGYEVAKVGHSNEFKNIAFIPIKAKILPQYDESTPQSITEVKSQKDSKANDINKSDNSDKSDESTPQSITEVKSQKDSKTNDINKSDNSEDVVVTVVSSDKSTPQSITKVKSQKDSKTNDINKSDNSDKSNESTPQSITKVKSQKDSKANDKNKPNNPEDVVVTAVSSEESTPQSITEVKSQKDSMANDTNKSYNSTESVPPSMGIKILSPKSGKEIPVGNLTIFGASTDNEKSNCSVSVDWNNQKPFQKAIATGPYGSDDYSSWTFTYSPSYHTIENGVNDLTSKLECVENSKVTTKWHSINVTGDITKDANPTSTLVYNDPLGILPQLKPLSTNPLPNTTGIASDETTIPPTKLSAYLVLPKDQIFPGEPQNFMVKISDPKTLQGVAGAKLDIKVVQGSVLLDEYNGTSDASGEYSWNLNSDTPSGKSDVLVSASANGYEPASITGSFQVQKQLLVQASLLKDLVVPGDNQTIDVKVMDANTKEIVSGANVMAKIGKHNEYKGTSDTSGGYSHSWNITSNTPSGKSDVLVSASANGYEPASITGSFQVQKQLLVQASLLKDLIVPGDNQTIDVKVMDANTKEIVSGANVMAKIGKDKYNGTSDTSGGYSHSWNITSNTPSGKSDVLVSASANGYEPASITGSFQVQRQLLVQASLLKDLVVPGDNQTIDVKVMDANTKEIVSGANVMAKIGGKNFSEKTDDSGVLSYSWNTPATSGGNRYDVVLNVSSHDYPKVMKTISFKMDKPQNLLEPPISNYEDKLVRVNTKDSNVNLESQNKFQECTNMLSSLTCSTEGDDKPVLNPTTDDKPVLNTGNENKNIQNDNQKQRNVYDFLSSVTK
jgi:hypothetical protein